MDRAGHAALAAPNASFPERLAIGSYLVLLPIVGVGTVALSLALLSGLWAPPRPYLVAGLLLVGFAAWVSAASFRYWQVTTLAPALSAEAGRVRTQRVRTGRPATPPPSPLPSRADAVQPHVGIIRSARAARGRAGGEGSRSGIRPRRPYGTGTPTVHDLATSAPPGGSTSEVDEASRNEVPSPDEPWWSIPPDSSPSLPPPAGASSPSTPSLPAPGPIGVPSPSTHGTTTTASSEPFTEAELDVLFPTGSPSGLSGLEGAPFAAAAGAMTAAPEASAPALATPSPSVPEAERTLPDPATVPAAGISGGQASLPSGASFAGWQVGSPFPAALGGPTNLDALDNPVFLEAVNPLPPHLRRPVKAGGPSTAPPGPSPPLRGSDPWSCIECHRGIWDFRSWTPCPACARPICRRCLRGSYTGGRGGYCTECRAPATLPSEPTTS